MECATAREELSASLDGEPITDPPALDAHLRGCSGCAAWRASAKQLGMLARSEFAETPDLTVAVLEAAAAQRQQRQRQNAAAAAGRRRMLRIAVAVAAAVQLALAVPALLAASGMPGLTAVHAGREMASFDIAVAVGFLLAAIRPERARAFVPVACVLAGCLALTSGMDLMAGVTGVADEAGHLVALVQAVLLWALGRQQQGRSQAGATVTT
jgi:predicted anti-sigma-YlaC factor YlaD